MTCCSPEGHADIVAQLEADAERDPDIRRLLPRAREVLGVTPEAVRRAAASRALADFGARKRRRSRPIQKEPWWAR